VIVLVPLDGPVREHNTCHTPSGPQGGQFCGTPSSASAPAAAEETSTLSPGARAAQGGQIERATPEAFKASLMKNARAGTLSDYSLDELGQMQLYKVKGFDAGYAIKGGNELVNLYNSGGPDAKGAGPWLVLHAIEHGVTHGDHFHGYLTRFYQRLGFKEVKREKNWTPGGPDVVYIEWAGGDRHTARARYRAAGHLDAG
jgi:hypothetical protein